MSAPYNIAQAADLVDLSIQKIHLKSSSPDVIYPKYFNVRKTSDYHEKDSSLTGLGEADFVDENAVIASDTPIQGFDKQYTQNMVGVIIPFTHRMWKFGIKKRDLTNVVSELRLTIARKKEKLCAERIDNGNDSGTSYTHNGSGGSRTITTTGGDSLNAFDDDHTREDGGTVMNNYVYDGTTYNLPLDYAGLKAAHRTSSLMVDGRGNPRPANLTDLLVKTGSAIHFKAMEIQKAIKDNKIPESNDNDGSGVKSFNIVHTPYLTNAAYWSMFDRSRALTDREGFQFIESQATQVDPVNVVYKTKEIQTSATAMFDLGHNDVARCWVHSKGNSANPSD